MSASPAAAAAPAPAVTCEIWIRHVGSRRQAFYRPIQPIGQRTRSWHALSVPQAEKALRDGKITRGEFAGYAVVPRETHAENEHPAAAAFRESAQLINRQIDTLNSAASSAA